MIELVKTTARFKLRRRTRVRLWLAQRLMKKPQREIAAEYNRQLDEMLINGCGGPALVLDGEGKWDPSWLRADLENDWRNVERVNRGEG